MTEEAANPPSPATTETDPTLLGGQQAGPNLDPFDAEKFTFPEALAVSDEDKTLVAALAKDYNIPHEAMTKLLDHHAKIVGGAADGLRTQVTEAWNNTVKEWQTAVETKYGDKLNDAVVRLAPVIDEMGGPEFREMLNLTGAGNHPAMFAMLEKVAAAIGESKPVISNGESPAIHPLAAQYPSMVKKG